MKIRIASAAACLCLILAAVPADAHIGSPDVYVKANAGPYALLVSVHPPAALPGAAEVEVRADDSVPPQPQIAAVEVSIVSSTQTPEPLKRFGAGALGGQSFTGSLWTASPGIWRLRIHVAGTQGEAETSVPVPASAQPGAQTRASWGGIAMLTGVSIAAGIGAGLLLGFTRGPLRLASGIAAAAVLLLVAAGWAHAGRTPGPPQMRVALAPGGKLSLSLPGRSNDLVPDHNHLMHLFALRQPEMDVLLHLHPEQLSPGHFEAQLPSMPPGAFTLFADIVHADGTPETFVADAGLPFQIGRPLQGDDAFGVVPGLRRSDPNAASIQLPDGYRMTFDRSAIFHARTGELLRFTLLDPTGNPPADMQLYMGMAAHAAIVKTDGTVFAHIHPAGNLPMAAYGANMAGMDMPVAPVSQVAFPFGFPSAGQYRIFVEMKHGATIETGAFDVSVQ
jgi:hypothetical protein